MKYALRCEEEKEEVYMKSVKVYKLNLTCAVSNYSCGWVVSQAPRTEFIVIL